MTDQSIKKLDKERIKGLYFNFKSCDEIADIFQCGRTTVYNILKELGVSKSLSERRKELFKIGKLNKPKGMANLNHTDISKIKISKTMKSKIEKGELIPHNKGKTKDNYKPLEIAGEKIRSRLSNPKNHPMFGKKREDISLLNKSRWMDPNYRLKRINHLKEAHKGNHYSTKTEFKKGLKHDKKWHDVVSKKMSGKNNPSWMGGLSFEPYGFEFNEKLKNEIRVRDNFTCQECSINQDKLKRRLTIHHIDYNKKNNKKTNLISLCHQCHLKTNQDRKHWTKHFKMIMFIRILLNPKSIVLSNKNRVLGGTR